MPFKKEKMLTLNAKTFQQISDIVASG